MSNSNKRPMIGLSFVLLAGALVLAACHMPVRTTPAQSGIDLIATYAAQTVQAQLTEVSKPPVPTPFSTPSATINPTGQPTGEPQQTTTPGDTPESTPSCNVAKFVKDLTIPDDTALPPGTPFKKTWRLQNDGTCSWSPQYRLVYYKGDNMGAPDSILLTNKVITPGNTVDVSIDMIAPDTAGTYRSEWKLSGESNEIFGVGSKGNPIWVQVQVVTESGLDFVSRASSAQWRSGIANEAPTDLVFGGDLNDPNGVARIENGVKLENGRISGKVLLTYPKHQNNSWISGTYQPYTIHKGNHFEARLSFLANQDGTCGAGKVTYELRYKEGDNVLTLGSWQKSCDGTLLHVDLDLSRLQGKTVQFILTVRSDGSAVDDWAIWNSPQITD